MKKLISLLLIVAFMCSLAACQQTTQAPATEADAGGASTVPEAAATAEPTASTDAQRVITWMTVRSSWTAMNLVAEQYMAQHPNVKIEFEIVSDRSSYNQKLRILAASKELPELFDSEADSALAEIANTGVLLDIDQLYADLGYTDKMMQIGLSYPRMSDGKLYSIAWENNVEYFWYHKDLFTKAGITAAPTTFDEFLADCQKLKDAGISPISTWPGWESLRWLSFIPFRLTGNDFIDGLKAGSVKMSDPAGIQAAEFFQTLGTKYFQPGWSTSDYTNALETFLSSNAAIYYIGAWQFGSFLDESGNLKEDYAYFKLPTLDGAVNDATSMFANAGTGTCVNKDKYDDQVKDFLKFVLENYPNIAFNETNTMPPMAFEPAKELSDFNKSVLADCQSLTNYAKTWDVALNSSVADVMEAEVTNLGMGAITPKEFAQRVDDAIAANAGK